MQKLEHWKQKLVCWELAEEQEHWNQKLVHWDILIAKYSILEAKANALGAKSSALGRIVSPNCRTRKSTKTSLSIILVPASLSYPHC